MSRSEDLQLVPGCEFIIRWNLKKFSMFGAKENNQLISRNICIPSLGNSEWYLKLVSKGSQEDNMVCFLCRTDSGPDNIKVFYSISVDSSYAVAFQTFAKKASNIIGAINQNKFINEVSRGVSEDVLHIECRLWPGSDAEQILSTLVSPYPVFVSTSTEMLVEDRSFFYEVKNFSNRPQNEFFYINLSSACLDNFKLVFRLWIEGDKLKVIVHEPEGLEQELLFVLKCKIEFLDIVKKRHLVYSGRAVFNSKGDGSDKTWTFPLSLSRKELIKKKNLFLPDDVLLLHCGISVSGTSSIPMIESTRYDTSDAQKTNHNFRWGLYIDHTYNEHRFFFRILAILVVVLSVLPHLYFDNTL